MQISIPICLHLLLAIKVIKGANMDQLNKKAKDPIARKHIEEMLREVSSSGKDDIQDVRGNGLHLRTLTTDKTGSKHMRYQQEYEGLPIFGFHVIVRDTPATSIAELDRETNKPTGRMIKIKKEMKFRGEYVDGLEKELGKIDKTKLNPNVALEKFKERNGTKVADERVESVIFINEQSGKAQVAYKVSFMNEGEKLSIPTALYDLDGNVIMEWDDLQTQSIVNKGTGPGGNKKTGKYTYGGDKCHLLVNDTGNGMCRYETRKVRVINLNGSEDIYFDVIFEYPCYNQAGDEINGGYSPLNDANYFAHVVFTMYEAWYSDIPVKEIPITLKVHKGKNYAGAYYHPNTKVFIIGDGDNTTYPFTALGVLSHEIAHAFTEKYSGLVYHYQSGGLNEAFSDMADRAAARFLHGYNKNTFEWRIDLEIFKAKDGHGRCMNDPPCDNSIDNINDYYDGLNVHHSSGIFNKVFYLLSSQFKYDVRDAFDLFYVVNRKIWCPNTTFLKAAENTLEALDEMHKCLYNSCCYSWIESKMIVDAFIQVGIGCNNNGTDWNCHIIGKNE